jgi:hypothetical protein
MVSLRSDEGCHLVIGFIPDSMHNPPQKFCHICPSGSVSAVKAQTTKEYDYD